MAQQITPEDVHRGTFHCKVCDTELPVFLSSTLPEMPQRLRTATATVE